MSQNSFRLSKPKCSEENEEEIIEETLKEETQLKSF